MAAPSADRAGTARIWEKVPVATVPSVVCRAAAAAFEVAAGAGAVEVVTTGGI